MPTISASLKRHVIMRASRRCEYCFLSQDGQEATFHIDHIIPVIAGGATSEANLALACVSCSLHKGAQSGGADLATGLQSQLYHPRMDMWNEHFRWESELLIGLTAKGRVTIEALKMNRPLILSIRLEEMQKGRHPQRTFPPES